MKNFIPFIHDYVHLNIVKVISFTESGYYDLAGRKVKEWAKINLTSSQQQAILKIFRSLPLITLSLITPSLAAIATGACVLIETFYPRWVSKRTYVHLANNFAFGVGLSSVVLLVRAVSLESTASTIIGLYGLLQSYQIFRIADKMEQKLELPEVVSSPKNKG